MENKRRDEIDMNSAGYLVHLVRGRRGAPVNPSGFHFLVLFLILFPEELKFWRIVSYVRKCSIGIVKAFLYVFLASIY